MPLFDCCERWRAEAQGQPLHSEGRASDQGELNTHPVTMLKLRPEGDRLEVGFAGVARMAPLENHLLRIRL